MDPHQKIKAICPFHEEEVLDVLLDVLWWPSHKSIKTSRSAVAKSTTYRRETEGHVLLSDRCPYCGKTKSEIEKVWKEGSRGKVDKTNRLEELKRLGFSGRMRG